MPLYCYVKKKNEVFETKSNTCEKSADVHIEKTKTESYPKEKFSVNEKGFKDNFFTRIKLGKFRQIDKQKVNNINSLALESEEVLLEGLQKTIYTQKLTAADRPAEPTITKIPINPPSIANKKKYLPFPKITIIHSARTSRFFSTIIPTAFLVAGLSLIGSALFPIIVWEVRYLPYNKQENIAKPLPESVLASEAESDKITKAISVDKDLTMASSWFAKQQQRPKIEAPIPKIDFYELSIPKLRIQDASVEVGGEDLEKHLIHYAGTAFPGQLGNTVIFGHSTLPVFFNPKSYKTIFANLPELKNGDEILINFDGISYKYIVFDKEVVSPNNTSVLEQSYSNSYITLITCFPPGTYLKRLAVRAQLKSN